MNIRLNKFFVLLILLFFKISIGNSQEWPIHEEDDDWWNVVSCTFGEIHPTDGDHFHSGIDIDVISLNCPVYSFAAGLVPPNGIGAATVEVIHEYPVGSGQYNRRTRYVHINPAENLISTGDIIASGQELTAVSNGFVQGVLYGDHLHFEIWQTDNNQFYALNPLDQLESPQDNYDPQFNDIILQPIDNHPTGVNSGFIIVNTEGSITEFQTDFVKVHYNDSEYSEGTQYNRNNNNLVLFGSIGSIANVRDLGINNLIATSEGVTIRRLTFEIEEELKFVFEFDRILQADYLLTNQVYHTIFDNAHRLFGENDFIELRSLDNIYVYPQKQINNIQSNGIWFTKAHNSTERVFNITPTNIAQINREALYPDNEYELEYTASDAASNEVSEQLFVILDNFLPYVDQVQITKNTNESIYNVDWSWVNGVLNFGTPPTNPICDDLETVSDIIITTSEPMQDLTLEVFRDNTSILLLPTQTSDDYTEEEVTEWTFNIDQILGDGNYRLEISGQDLAGNEIVNDPDQLYVREDETTWAPDPGTTNRYDNNHTFEVAVGAFVTANFELSIDKYIVEFTDISTATGDGVTIHEWIWDFGDESPDFNGQYPPTHEYPTLEDPTTYTVTLDIKSNSFDPPLTDSHEEIITISEYYLPTADFVFTIEQHDNKALVTFEDKSSSSSSTITKWVWYFGDGIEHEYYSNEDFVYEFSTNEDRYVTLTVIDEMGVSSLPTEKLISINITPTFYCDNRQIGGPMNYEIEIELPPLPTNEEVDITYSYDCGNGDKTSEPITDTYFKCDYDEAGQYAYSAEVIAKKVSTQEIIPMNPCTGTVDVWDWENPTVVTVTTTPSTVIFGQPYTLNLSVSNGIPPYYGSVILHNGPIVSDDPQTGIAIFDFTINDFTTNSFSISSNDFEELIRPATGEYAVTVDIISPKSFEGYGETIIDIVCPPATLVARIDLPYDGDPDSPEIIDVPLNDEIIFNSLSGPNQQHDERRNPSIFRWTILNSNEEIVDTYIKEIDAGDIDNGGYDMVHYKTFPFEGFTEEGEYYIVLETWNQSDHPQKLKDILPEDACSLESYDYKVETVFANSKILTLQLEPEKINLTRRSGTASFNIINSKNLSTLEYIAIPSESWIHDVEITDYKDEAYSTVTFKYDATDEEIMERGAHIEIKCENAIIYSKVIFSIKQDSKSGEDYVRLLPTNDRNDKAGESVAIYGNYAAVGAPSFSRDHGKVYIYYKNEDGLWEFLNEITPPTLERNAEFGKSVAMNGNYLVVGEPYRELSGKQNGRVYIYTNFYDKRNWQLVSTLSPQIPRKGSFGYSVAMDNQTILVGSPEAKTDEGRKTGLVYAFYQPDGSWDIAGVRNEDYIIKHNDPSKDDEFGFDVDVFHDKCIVGAPKKDDKGAVYIFHKANATEWTQVKKLTQQGSYTEDVYGSVWDRSWDLEDFGRSVSIYDVGAIISGYREVVDVDYYNSRFHREKYNHGKIWFCKYKDNEWSISDGPNSKKSIDTETFGISTAMINNRTYIGDPQVDQAKWDDLVKKGTVLDYKRTLNQNGFYEWNRGEPVEDNPWPGGPDEEYERTEGDLFGQSIDYDGIHLIIGSPGKKNVEKDAGAAYIYLINSNEHDKYCDRTIIEDNLVITPGNYDDVHASDIHLSDGTGISNVQFQDNANISFYGNYIELNKSFEAGKGFEATYIPCVDASESVTNLTLSDVLKKSSTNLSIDTIVLETNSTNEPITYFSDNEHFEFFIPSNWQKGFFKIILSENSEMKVFNNEDQEINNIYYSINNELFFDLSYSQTEPVMIQITNGENKFVFYVINP